LYSFPRPKRQDRVEWRQPGRGHFLVERGSSRVAPGQAPDERQGRDLLQGQWTAPAYRGLRRLDEDGVVHSQKHGVGEIVQLARANNRQVDLVAADLLREIRRRAVDKGETY